MITQQQRKELTLAAVDCEHQIDADCIRLWRDPTKEGTALAQLMDRIEAKVRQYIEQGAQPGADVVLRELVEANREPLWLHATNSRPRDGQSFEDWQAEQAEDQAHRARRTARLEAAWVAAYNLVPAAPQPQQEQSK